MEKTIEKKKFYLGCLAFGFSGICAMSSGVVVSLLQEIHGFDYGISGTLLSLMNVGNLLASFAAGILPAKIGARGSVLFLCSGYTVGYLLLGGSKAIGLLALGFLLLGFAKGGAINNSTLLVSENSRDRTKGMNLMHASYALGALSGPLVISAALLFGNRLPMVFLAVLGVFLWLTFLAAKLPGREKRKVSSQKKQTDWGFLRQKKFWLLTGLIFCQNAAETSVTGWLVTYYKGSGILSEAVSPYTITILWGATLIARLLIAFVIPIKNRFRTLAWMGVGCTALYGCLIFADQGITALLALFLFSFAIAGVNPTAMAGAGSMLSPASVGVLLPLASSGAILMPWIIGLTAEQAGLRAGMFCNLIPCFGICLFSLLCAVSSKKEQE